MRTFHVQSFNYHNRLPTSVLSTCCQHIHFFVGKRSPTDIRWPKTFNRHNRGCHIEPHCRYGQSEYPFALVLSADYESSSLFLCVCVCTVQCVDVVVGDG